MRARVLTEGIVQFHVSVRVDVSEFAGWKPERIAAFFAGITQVLAASGTVEKEANYGGLTASPESAYPLTQQD